MSARKLSAIWTILLLLLLLRFTFLLINKPQYQAGENVSFTTILTTEPSVQSNGQRFRLNNIEIWTTRFPPYHYGDTLTISGHITQPKTSSQKSRMLGKMQQDFTMYFPKIEPEKSTSTGILAVVSTIRQHIVVAIGRIFPSSSAALFSGIFIGSKESFSGSFLDALRNTGTLHVVAASGMNITMLSSFLTVLFLKLFHRRAVAILIIVSMCFYALLALLAPSIVRAAIMGGMVSLTSLLGRQTNPFWALALACYSMLLFEPFLLFDIGFQLSFAATGGILFLKPTLTEVFIWFKHLTKIPIFGDDIATTIVAQVATLPILLGNFGSISLVSILVNALILWTVPIIMALGLVFALTSFLPIIPNLFAMVAFPFLTFFQTIVLFFNKPQFVLAVKTPLLLGMGYYCLLVSFYILLRKKMEEHA